MTFTQEELYGAEIFLVYSYVFLKFFPANL